MHNMSVDLMTRLGTSPRLNFGLLYPSIFFVNGLGLFPTSNDNRRSEDLVVKKIHYFNKNK